MATNGHQPGVVPGHTWPEFASGPIGVSLERTIAMLLGTDRHFLSDVNIWMLHQKEIKRIRTFSANSISRRPNAARDYHPGRQ